jgi:hypothetical protein
MSSGITALGTEGSASHDLVCGGLSGGIADRGVSCTAPYSSSSALRCAGMSISVSGSTQFGIGISVWLEASVLPFHQGGWNIGAEAGKSRPDPFWCPDTFVVPLEYKLVLRLEPVEHCPVNYDRGRSSERPKDLARST